MLEAVGCVVTALREVCSYLPRLANATPAGLPSNAIQPRNGSIGNFQRGVELRGALELRIPPRFLGLKYGIFYTGHPNFCAGYPRFGLSAGLRETVDAWLLGCGKKMSHRHST